MADVIEVEELRCTRCALPFGVCTPCFRGQGYCSPTCRDASVREMHRAANDRYQKSEHGRLDHADRMQAYRERLEAAGAAEATEIHAAEVEVDTADVAEIQAPDRSVTDSASRKLDSPMKWPSRGPVIVRKGLYVSPFSVVVEEDPAPCSQLRCCVCGVLGRRVLRHRSRAPP